MTEVKGKTKQSIEFLRRWSPEEPWVLTSIIPDGGRTTTETFYPEKADECAAWIEERQGRQNIYFTVNPVNRDVRSKPKKSDMRGMRALHVDVDPRPGEEFADERVRGLKVLQDFAPQPTVIIDSGGGFQGFWLLEEEEACNGTDTRIAELEAYNLQIEVLTQGDSCHNIDRIMRLPGTINVPGEKKRKKGRVPALAKVVQGSWSLRYPLEDFTPAPRVQTPDSGGGPEVKLSGNLPRIESLDDLPDLVTDKMKQIIVQGDDPDDPMRYGSRSEAVFGVLCELVRAKCTDDQMAAVMLDPDYGISAHILAQPRPQQYAARQIQRAREHAINPWLRKLNEQHAVIEDIGGKCRVISEVMDHAMKRTRITRQSFEDFRNRYMHIDVELGKDKEGNAIKVPLGKYWLGRQERRQYKTIVFAPGQEVTDAYNLWKGFGCEIVPGDCSLFLEHIKENICGGNEVHYEYLMSWMARAVQQPDSQGEVAVVLRGRMGAGKSFFVKAFGSLWGRHFLQVSDPKHLVGSFNAHLRDCVVLFGDEAFFAGDKKHESILKAMVTEETIMVEPKGVDAEASPNYLHILMASNSEWVVPAGVDERRFFVLDVGDDRMQDKPYFRAIAKQLDSGGREALLHMLMTRNLDDFDVRNFPRTAALQEQKLLSLSAEEQWWFEKLQEGKLITNREGWPEEVMKNDLLRDYIAYADQQKLMRRMSPTALGKFVSRVLPEHWPRTFQRYSDVSSQDRFGHEQIKKVRAWHYGLPTLEGARQFWDERFGGPYDWPSDDVEEAREPWQE